MPSTHLSKIILAFAFVVSAGFFSASPANALGLSPPTIEVSDLLRDTTQTRSVSLFRAPDDVGDVLIHVQPDEQDVDFFVLQETDVVMFSGQNEITYEFGVTPANAQNGEYEWKLRFLKAASSSDGSTGNSVAVVTGVTAQILATVGGEERLEYEIASLYALPTEEGLDTSVVYSVNNSGNVDWQPSKIVFTFFDSSGASVGEYALEDDQIETVRAGMENQSFTVNVPAVLTRGAYSVTAAFYQIDSDESETIETSQPFDVYAPGTLAQSGTLKSLSLNKEAFSVGEKVKLSAIFENDGEVNVDASLVTEISRDGQILDLVRSNEYAVSPGEEIVLSELILADTVGAYQLSSYVEYASRQTASKAISFEVRDSVSGIDFGGTKISSLLNSPAGLIGLALAMILFVILLVRLKRRKKPVPIRVNEPERMPAPQTTETLPTNPLSTPSDSSVPTESRK